MSENPQEQESPPLAVLHKMPLPVAVEELAWQCQALLAQFENKEAIGVQVQDGHLQFVMPEADYPVGRHRLPWNKHWAMRLAVRLVHDRGEGLWYFEQRRGGDEWNDIPGTSAQSEEGARRNLQEYIDQRREELKAMKPVFGPMEVYIIE